MIERVLIAGAAAAGTALIVGTYAGSAIAMLVMATLAAVATVVVMWLADRHISADVVQLTRVTAPGSAMAEPGPGRAGVTVVRLLVEPTQPEVLVAVRPR